MRNWIRTRRGRQLVLVLPLATGLSLAAGCGRRAEPAGTDVPLMAFDTAALRFVTARDTIRVAVEVARTRDQQTMGLMERRSLADTAGMIFVYEADQAATASFWMFRTRIPLDIAFADSSGRIGSIVPMVPCESATARNCPTYPPGVSYRLAVEMNAGWYARHGVAVGDRILFDSVPGDPVGSAVTAPPSARRRRRASRWAECPGNRSRRTRTTTR